MFLATENPSCWHGCKDYWAFVLTEQSHLKCLNHPHLKWEGNWSGLGSLAPSLFLRPRSQPFLAVEGLVCTHMISLWAYVGVSSFHNDIVAA